MSNGNIDSHNQAMAIFDKLKWPGSRVVAAKRTMWDYNEKRNKMTAGLKPILAAMQEKFESDEPIAACRSMKEYRKQFQSFGCLTYARVRRILTDKSGNEYKKVKTLKVGDLISISGMTYRTNPCERCGAYETTLKVSGSCHGTERDPRDTMEGYTANGGATVK
jgi:hypothetical protein